MFPTPSSGPAVPASQELDPRKRARKQQSGQVRKRRRTSLSGSQEAGPTRSNVPPVETAPEYVAFARRRPNLIEGRPAEPAAPAPRSADLQDIVSESHLEPISEVCRKYKYTISVRATGKLSIKRIEEGAKAKPHTILEKTIKRSSVEAKYTSEAGEVIERLDSLDLTGFVGHWGEDGLKGVRIDNAPPEIRSKSFVQRAGAGGELYVPVDVTAAGGGQALAELKREANWKQYLYTGDYDLHEAYAVRGMGGGAQIPEATVEKMNLLNRLNEAIARGDEKQGRRVRSGRTTRAAGGGTLHMSPGSDYAMFQHGDQATYRMNQYLEAKASAGNEPGPAGKKPKVGLVKAVATESDEPLAWCRFGVWYVTRNRAEHAELRRRWKLTPPHTWGDAERERTEKGLYKTAEYT
jgi:hypothetical protein